MSARNPCIIPVGPYAGRIGYWLAEAAAYWNVAVWLPGEAVALYDFKQHHLTRPTERHLTQRLKSIRCPINADRSLANRALLLAEEAYIVSLQQESHPLPQGTRVAVKFRVGPPRIGRIVGPAAGYGAAYVVAVPSTLRSGKTIDHVFLPDEFAVIED